MWCGEMTVPSTTNQACQSTARLTSSLSDSLTTTYPFCLRVETLASIGITAHFALQKRPEPKLPSWFLPHACTPPPTRRQHTARHWFRDDIMMPGRGKVVRGPYVAAEEEARLLRRLR